MHVLCKVWSCLIFFRCRLTYMFLIFLSFVEEVKFVWELSLIFVSFCALFFCCCCRLVSFIFITYYCCCWKDEPTTKSWTINGSFSCRCNRNQRCITNNSFLFLLFLSYCLLFFLIAMTVVPYTCDALCFHNTAHTEWHEDVLSGRGQFPQCFMAFWCARYFFPQVTPKKALSTYSFWILRASSQSWLDRYILRHNQKKSLLI